MHNLLEVSWRGHLGVLESWALKGARPALKGLGWGNTALLSDQFIQSRR